MRHSITSNFKQENAWNFHSVEVSGKNSSNVTRGNKSALFSHTCTSELGHWWSSICCWLDNFSLSAPSNLHARQQWEQKIVFETVKPNWMVPQILEYPWTQGWKFLYLPISVKMQNWPLIWHNYLSPQSQWAYVQLLKRWPRVFSFSH